jgi:hypothetical protein
MIDAWREAMLGGEFERAWAISDRVLRRRRGQCCAGLPYHLQWVWDGRPLAGCDVLVRCYQGLGDTLQFSRLVPRLARLARRVTVEAQPQLLPLLRGLGGVSALCPLGGGLPPFEVAIEAMELPHALRLRLCDLPGPVPYLSPPPKPSANPCGWPARPERLRVGIVWAAGDWRRERSLPPELLVPFDKAAARPRLSAACSGAV